ncbi:MAG: Ppx/GppA phosphatase family protein [Pseudomonadota bacterium]|nr:Ppx/GppA phosphatase family protein [Pseudomonadota bacterium]
MRLGVIDIGTNSCHLVVASISQSGQIDVLDTDKATLRLGMHIDAQGNLTQQAIQSTINAVTRMQEICKSHKAQVKAVATHAVRKAKNQQEIIQKVWDACGIRIDPIDGVEEARLIFLGMRFGLTLTDQTYLGVDIGGGSTEVIFGSASRIIHAASLPIGTVMMTVRFLGGVPSTQQVEEFKEYLTSILASSMLANVKLVEFSEAIVSSGTGKALAAIDHYLQTKTKLKDSNGYLLQNKDCQTIIAKMEELRAADAIAKHFALDNSRAEIILAGALILQVIADHYQVQAWRVSNYCLREGIVIDTYEHYIQHADTRWRSVKGLAEKFCVDRTQAERVLQLATQLFKSLPAQLLPPTASQQCLELLAAAAYLHELGKTIAHERYHKHTYYLIMHSALMGFNRREKEIIARIARHHRKRIPPDMKHLTAEDNQDIRLLSSILRIAVATLRLRHNRIREVKMSYYEILAITFYYEKTRLPLIELYNLRCEQQAIEATIGATVSFSFRQHKSTKQIT